jgi:hypothetical protein
LGRAGASAWRSTAARPRQAATPSVPAPSSQKRETIRTNVASPWSPEKSPSVPEAEASVEIPQYSVLRILAVWAAAALPMAALAWLVAPALEDELGGEGNVPMAKALLLSLTSGLIWQFVLVAILVWREQRTLAGRSCVRRSGSVPPGIRTAVGAAAGCG